MKKFHNFKDLINEIKVEEEYAKYELDNFLEWNGSEVVRDENIPPKLSFELDTYDKKYKIGITCVGDIVDRDILPKIYWIIND